MALYEIYAQILDGEVKHVGIYNNYPDADYITKCVYGSEAYAVNCNQYDVSTDDKYHDGFFWKVNPDTGEETMVEYIPTQEQQVQTLQAEKDALMLALADVIGGSI